MCEDISTGMLALLLTLTLDQHLQSFKDLASWKIKIIGCLERMNYKNAIYLGNIQESK